MSAPSWIWWLVGTVLVLCLLSLVGVTLDLHT